MSKEYVSRSRNIKCLLKEPASQKGDKGGMANAKMYTFLEQNVVARTPLCLHKLTHRLAPLCECTYKYMQNQRGPLRVSPVFIRSSLDVPSEVL